MGQFPVRLVRAVEVSGEVGADGRGSGEVACVITRSFGSGDMDSSWRGTRGAFLRSCCRVSAGMVMNSVGGGMFSLLESMSLFIRGEEFLCIRDVAFRFPTVF